MIAVGTGAALRMAARGDADVLLVHAPSAERPYVEAGDLVDGRAVMHNDFVIVGPGEDPAGIRSLTTVARVMRAIAARGIFVSRGDDSGTHTAELALWAAAGIDPRSLGRREETGQGMGAAFDATTLLVTHDRHEALRLAQDLVVLVDGRVHAAGDKREIATRPRVAGVAEVLGYSVLAAGGRRVAVPSGALQPGPGPVEFSMIVEDILDLVERWEVAGRVGEVRARVGLPSAGAAPARGERWLVHAERCCELAEWV